MTHEHDHQHDHQHDENAEPSNPQTIQFAREDIDRLAANLRLSAGELLLAGGAARMVDAEITCSVPGMQPSVDYQTDDNRVGRLNINQQRINWHSNQRGRFKNEWQVGIADDVPLDLNLDITAARADLQLDSLNLQNFDLLSNAGNLNLSLTGDHDDLGAFCIQGNALKLNARIHGSFANTALMDFELNAAKATFDFSGEWAHDQDFAFETSAGWLKLRLPNNVGVRVFTQTSLASVKSPGFTKETGALVNAHYGHAPITLTIDLAAQVGRVELELVDRIPVEM